MFRPLHELMSEPRAVIPTGILAIDTITGGGIPVGHITDIVGEKGLGKTTLALHTAGRYMAAGHPVYYIDSEFSFHAAYAATFLPPHHDRFFVLQQSVAEQVFSALEEAATTPHALLILDSINALLPSPAATERGVYDTAIGHMARITTVFLKRIIPLLHQHHSTLLIINQYRANIVPSIVRAPDKKPAGFHYYHHCIFTRIELARGEEVKDVGRVVIAKTTKNKAVGANQVATYIVKHRGGIDVVQDHVDFALRAGILTRSGTAWYHYTNPDTGEVRKVNGAARVPTILPLDTIYTTVLRTVLPPSPSVPSSVPASSSSEPPSTSVSSPTQDTVSTTVPDTASDAVPTAAPAPVSSSSSSSEVLPKSSLVSSQSNSVS